MPWYGWILIVAMVCITVLLCVSMVTTATQKSSKCDKGDN
jgi:hypothetical protein